MLVGLMVVWREDGAEGAEIDKNGMVIWLEKGCPGVGSQLVDFGYLCAHWERGERFFCGSRPKVLVQRTKGTTKNSYSRRLSTKK